MCAHHNWCAANQATPATVGRIAQEELRLVSSSLRPLMRHPEAQQRATIELHYKAQRHAVGGTCSWMNSRVWAYLPRQEKAGRQATCLSNMNAGC